MPLIKKSTEAAFKQNIARLKVDAGPKGRVTDETRDAKALEAASLERWLLGQLHTLQEGAETVANGATNVVAAEESGRRSAADLRCDGRCRRG